MVALTEPRDGLDPAAPEGDVSCSVKCCVDLYGIADISTCHDVPMLGKTRAEAPDLYRLASPVNYIRTNSPPFLILHGTADTTVRLAQSELLAERLKQAGVEHELMVIPGAPHTFDLQPPQRDLRPIVLEFLNANLKRNAAHSRQKSETGRAFPYDAGAGWQGATSRGRHLLKHALTPRSVSKFAVGLATGRLKRSHERQRGPTHHKPK
jgi:acetyl esterase/lipase